MRRIKSHTLQKLEYFGKYIEAYLAATKKMPHKYYIDAFAGTGKCILCDESCKCRGGIKCMECGKGENTDGSALIALKVQKSFTGYIFIDSESKNIDKLKIFISKEIEKERQLKSKEIVADSNKLLLDIYKVIPQYAGCFIFLDPEGPELFWETIRYLSKIKKVELFILYPYDMALVRLTKNYKERLHKFYGSSKWLGIHKSGKSPQERKDKLLNFYIANLKSLGFEYVVYRQIRRGYRDGKALYHLILVTHHHVGEKIMKDIFDKELDGQQKLKF